MRDCGGLKENTRYVIQMNNIGWKTTMAELKMTVAIMITLKDILPNLQKCVMTFSFNFVLSFWNKMQGSPTISKFEEKTVKKELSVGGD